MTRRWCHECQAEREAWHVHGDPLEALDREELLRMVRALVAHQLKNRQEQPDSANGEANE